MKGHQKSSSRNHFASIFLAISAINLPCSPVLAGSQTQVKSEDKPLRLETFVDRKILKEKEEIGINVWIDSDLIDNAAVTVFFPETHLEMKENISCQNRQKKLFL